MSCEWMGWCALDPSAQAAWVQAIGGIAAVIAAFVLPLALYYSDRRNKRLSDRRTLHWFLIKVLPALLNASRAFQNFIEMYSPQGTDEADSPFKLDPDHADFDIDTAMKRIVTILEGAPLLLYVEGPFSRLALEIAALNEYFAENGDQQARGLHHAWQRDLPDILAMCEKVLQRINVLIDRIRDELKIKDF